MKSKVFMEAAKMIYRERVYFSCDAIEQVYTAGNATLGIFFDCREEYAELMCPYPCNASIRFDTLGWFGSPNIKKNQKARLTSLILMSVIMEAQGE